MSKASTFYSASEVCKIISACLKGGVSKISLPDIEIFFGERHLVDQPKLIIPPSVENLPQGIEPEKQLELLGIIADQKAETMHLVDPEQWEMSELMEMDKDEARR